MLTERTLNKHVAERIAKQVLNQYSFNEQTKIDANKYSNGELLTSALDWLKLAEERERTRDLGNAVTQLMDCNTGKCKQISYEFGYTVDIPEQSTSSLDYESSGRRYNQRHILTRVAALILAELVRLDAQSIDLQTYKYNALDSEKLKARKDNQKVRTRKSSQAWRRRSASLAGSPTQGYVDDYITNITSMIDANANTLI